MDSPKLGISSCLLGEPVRYDGGHKLNRYLRDTLGTYVRFVPVCPEVECGLPVPREAMHLEGIPDAPRLVTIRSGVDHTARMQKWMAQELNELEHENLSGFIFKARSPSSGIRGVKYYQSDSVSMGPGLFGGAFIKRFPFIPVEDEGRINDPGLRENFIERVFAYHRWLEFLRKGFSIGRLVEFHGRHKLMLMAHSPKHYTVLGRIVANAKRYREDNLKETYLKVLLEGMTLRATVKKNTNVLQHIAGYFKKDLSGVDKIELHEVINSYHKGLVPLIVPITLLSHYVRKFDEPYLKKQYYLSPNPAELMLRNHV
jgi:uncharacterized protein YbgA (DUF1722 family)/uncharacterized protein YbbK (DUF523 family)